MNASSTLAVATLCAAATFAACTVHKTEAPALSGPSEFALSLSMTATPDSINQDGSSQSSVRVSAKGPDGRPVSGLPLRVDMQVHGLLQDFGTLSARSIVTGSDGVAQTVYTAPPKAVGGNTETCAQAPGTCVDIVATPTGTNYQVANGQIATIRLVPPGVILPPADSPTARFDFLPTTIVAGQPVLFDATGSCGGPISTSTGCTSLNTIVKYAWDFGDGTTDSGATPTHSFSSLSSRSFAVTLTVTNDRGFEASLTKTVSVAATAPPSVDFEFLPAAPVAPATVFFTQLTSPVGGRTNVRFDWTFHDGTVKSGTTVPFQYTTDGVFVVRLTVTDDIGQSSTKVKEVPVVKAGSSGTGLARSVSLISPKP
jgi:PKD repeat protein